MTSTGLAKRLRALEAMLSASPKQCSCRAGQHTSYHTVAELERIMGVPCSVHGVRDLGYLRWVGKGIPLHPLDQHLCDCPPSAVRDLLCGRRGPLSEEEEQEERQRWERDCAPAATEEFRHDQVCAKCLLQRYNYNLKRRRN